LLPYGGPPLNIQDELHKLARYFIAGLFCYICIMYYYYGLLAGLHYFGGE
jgi:hypothetical protein